MNLFNPHNSPRRQARPSALICRWKNRLREAKLLSQGRAVRSVATPKPAPRAQSPSADDCPTLSPSAPSPSRSLPGKQQCHAALSSGPGVGSDLPLVRRGRAGLGPQGEERQGLGLDEQEGSVPSSTLLQRLLRQLPFLTGPAPETVPQAPDLACPVFRPSHLLIQPAIASTSAS